MRTKSYSSDRTAKGDSEFSDYQREIEVTDNVILCVAKAEKYVRELGSLLINDTPEETEVQAATSSAFDSIRD